MLKKSVKYFERFEYISYFYLLQKYTDFWLYFFEACQIDDNDFNKLGIINKFNKYMYKSKIIFYFIKSVTVIILTFDL